MSDRNSSDYLNLDNFDEGIDSRDYRRRQPERRGGSATYGGRPSYDRRPTGSRQPYDRRPPNRRPSRRRRNRRRIRNRIIIITCFVLIIAVLFTLVAVLVNGCGKKNPSPNTSTDTKPPETSTVAAAASDATQPTTKAQQTASTAEKISPSNFIAPNPTDNGADGTNEGAIFVWNNSAFEQFGAGAESGKYYAETVNALGAKLRNFNVYSMIIPNHAEMGLPERVRSQSYSNPQAPNIKAAYDAMNTGAVQPINAYNYLSEHCNEYIYFKSDHHWTGLGAYYAYTAFADTLGLPSLSLSDCTEQKITGFTGTLTDLASGIDTDVVSYWQFPYTVEMDITDANGSVQTYDSPYYEQEGSGSLSYGVFIYGDNPLTVMRSSSPDAQKGKKIAVIKESYGNAFVPYLTNNYEEVHVMDMRTFRSVTTDDLAGYCQKNGITDILFFNGIMSANNQDLLDSMLALVN